MAKISSALRQVVHGTRWHAKRKSYKVLFWREITPLAVPIFMENACVLLMGVLSTFLVSWLGKDAMAGVGLADSFNMVIMAFFAAIDLGTTVVVAFSLGKRDRRRARVATRQSLVIMTLFAVLLATLIHHFGEQIIDFVAGDATTDVKALALTYLELTVLSYPAAAITLIGSGALRGAGNTKIPLLINGSLNILNIIIAEHIGVSGILAAVAAGMTITRSGVMRRAPLAMRLRANSTWAMLEFVFNGMVFLLLGLQLPGILETSLMAAEIDPNVEIWMLFTDIILIYAALMLVRFGWLWTMKKFSNRFLKKKPMEFGSWTTREILIASFAGVRGAITLAGVLSIPLLLPDGNVFPARYELVFLAAGVILFSLFVGVVMLPILLQHIEVADHSQQLKEERIARAATAEVAIVAIQKMEERLAADTEENIDNQLLTEVSSRVIGNLRRRADGRNDVESSVQEENLERRFRLAALRSERAELYHLRATREISNETLQKLLHDLDLLEALLIEENQ
ncbi:Na+/H+ antiporter [Escherichia sp. TWPC-MK]